MIILLTWEKTTGQANSKSQKLLARGQWRRREINAFFRFMKATMFSIGIAWQQHIGDVRESETVQRIRGSIPKTASGLMIWGKPPQSEIIRFDPVWYIFVAPRPTFVCHMPFFTHVLFVRWNPGDEGFQSFCANWLHSYVNLGVAISIHILLPGHWALTLRVQ